MATVEFSRPVPADLSERFLLQEAPVFEVVRAQGNVCLWRSTTAPHIVQGYDRPAKVAYHVTDGEHADYLLMRDPVKALATFEFVAVQQVPPSRTSGTNAT